MKHYPSTTAAWLFAFMLALLVGSAHGADTKARTLQGKVVSVGEQFGNLNTDIQLTAWEITMGQPLIVSCKGNHANAVFAGSYSDVAMGDWLVLANEDGTLQVAIHSGDADEQLGCAAGDSITVVIEAPFSF
jgi:S-adenosylmethionine hydrolase